MKGTIIELHPDMTARVRDIFPVVLSDNDIAWAAEWLLAVGIVAVRSGLREHPELSLGDVIRLTMDIEH